MTERAYSRAVRKNEIEDNARFERAASLIERDADLRFLFARFFESCGMATSPFSTDPLTMAHGCGKFSAAEELAALLNEYQPALYHDLMKELHNAERQRAADLADRLAAD